MKKSLKEFFPRLVFSLFFVYVFLLGVINLFIASNKEYLQSYLADILEAQSVTIGNISNLPLVFISGTEFTIVINDELTLSIEGVYFRYNLLKLFTKEFEQIPRDIQIERISFIGHNVELKKYIKHLQQKFPPSQTASTTNINTLLSRLNIRLFIKQITLKLNSMTEFWHTGLANNLSFQLQNNTLSWNSQIKLHSIWSNTVFLGETSFNNTGALSNFSSLNGNIQTSIQKLNLLGLPFVNSNMSIQVQLSDGVPTISLDNSASNNGIFFSTNNGLALTLKNSIDINYNDFEEYNFIDYGFKPGQWNFALDLTKITDWKLNVSLTSPQHPNYGLNLQLDSIIQNKLYSALLDLKTHYFGSLKGDLTVPIRQGLYPLPSGSLYLDNVRFVLNGLIFSGTANIEAIPNKNELDFKAYNVRMNNGLIGNTAVRFEFEKDNNFSIISLPHPSNAIDIDASISSGDINLNIKAHDVDGDFVAQNIKIPIFGIKDSRYRGMINLYKKDRKSDLFLNGYIKGFLDEEEQIDAIIALQETHINIPRFHIINPDILLSGDVIIDAQWSNTYIYIDALASYNSNELIPIDLTVDIQKNDTKVFGTVDQTITINTLTIGENTDFTALFPKYEMNKLGFSEIALDTKLTMDFDATGITRFNIEDGKIHSANRTFTLDFDTLMNTNTGVLDSTHFRIGMDQEIIEGFGYLTFLNNQFGGSFRFTQGGTFQFNIGRYIVKSRIELIDFNINNVFNIPILEPLSFLHHNVTESTSLSTELDIVGTWADLNLNGNIHLIDSDNTNFQLVLPELNINKHQIAFKDLRLRHPILNVDSNIFVDFQDNALNSQWEGSFTYNNNLIKSDFRFVYQLQSNVGVLNYHLPNFYALSKKPMNLQGKIYHNDNEYLFISDHAKYGFSGVLSRDNQNNFWDISLLSTSLRFFTEGVFQTNNTLLAKLNLDLFLNKITPSGELRSARGDIAIKSDISGNLDNPLVNGSIDLENIGLSLRSIRNRLTLANKQTISISNNQITIPDLSIFAQGGGEFGLRGLIDYNNQSIETANLEFYSKNPNNTEQTSFLDWNIDAPLVRTKVRSYISNITLTGNLDELILNANIETENLNFHLDLEDTLASSPAETSANPLLGLLESLNLDVNIGFGSHSRFLSQLFDFEFEQINPVKIEGNLGAGDIMISGDFSIDRGNIAYLNSDLRVTSGSINFSQESGDLLPSVIVNTETSQDVQNDLLDIFVNFEGKLPDLEISSISSSPSRSQAELLSILGSGTANNSSRNQQNNATGARDLIASSVGIAENTLFTAPLTRRVQQLVPFLDSVQLKTDILGNITRSTSGNGTAGGLGLLHGTELSVGQYIPGVQGLQANYHFRLESPNSTIDTASLNQIHQAGVSWNRIIPGINWQGGVGANVRSEQNPTQTINGQTEVLFEGSLRKRF